MSDDSTNLTILLHQWSGGDRTVENELFEIVEPHLRRIARHLLSRDRAGSLRSADLVNEVYIKILKAKDQDWRDRAHFYALMARMMRRHLIDRARARPKVKFEPLEDVANWLPVRGNNLDLVITIDRALTALEKEDPEMCKVVELKFFLGLSDEDAAKVLEIAERTVQRRWNVAKVWLAMHLGVAHAEKNSG